MEAMNLILASASPRRSELLKALGLNFRVEPYLGDEPAPLTEELGNPGAYVEKLARLKAKSNLSEGIIISADTVVVLGGEILGKPKSTEEAIAMLKTMRGQTHQVFTGVCVRNGEQIESAHEITRVRFGHVSDEFIAAYVATGEPMDKAGAYGAQGKGALLVEKIEGDYWNVVGLPLFRLEKMLRNFGVTLETVWNT
jgi:septum formation protein